MVNRRNDGEDILDKVSTGWQAPPTKPPIILEDRENTIGVYIHDNRRVALFRKGKRDENEMINQNAHESRLWILPLALIGSDEDDVDAMYLQAREVCNRYTNVPWSTSTLGTSTTYSTARIFRSRTDPRYPAFVIECEMELLEEMVAVVIA